MCIFSKYVMIYFYYLHQPYFVYLVRGHPTCEGEQCKKKEVIDIMRLPHLITHVTSCFVPEIRKTAKVSASLQLSFKMI